MTHNPYTPPAAVVADAATTALPPRPWQMKAALTLILLSLAIGLVSLALNPEALELGGMNGQQYAIVGTFCLVFLGLVAGVIVCVWRAHRWARIVYSALVVISLMGEFSDLPMAMQQPWVYNVLYLLSILADFATLVLLFTPAANAWFRAHHAARRAD
jgi:hypothetical protein